jgi:hypothetical protein
VQVPDTRSRPDAVEFNGRKFVLKKSGGGKGYYFANGKRANEPVRPSLHRTIYEAVNGPVPNGFDVHHADDDQFNNDPDNLIAVRNGEHQAEHMRQRLQDPVLRKLNDEYLQRARAAAPEWHRSPEGRAWHREHALAQWTDDARALRLTCGECQACGVSFERYHEDARYCSMACFQRDARHAGRYDDERECPICGSAYTTNRHHPSKTCGRRCGAILRHRAA